MTGPIGERPHMPGYGVETADWQPLPWTWAAERLAAGRNFWLVTVSSAGAPHAMPVWGVWDDGDLQFAFSCGPRSRKATNLAANSNVVVTTRRHGRGAVHRGPGSTGRGRAAGRLDRSLPGEVHRVGAGAERRVHSPEPPVRGRPVPRLGDHRAGRRVRRSGDALALRQRVTRRAPRRRPGDLRHTGGTAEGCYLPVLTWFAGTRCTGPDRHLAAHRLTGESGRPSR